MLVRIDCTASYASHVSHRITNNHGVHDLDIFIKVASFGRTDRPSSSVLSLPLLNSIFPFAIRRLLPKGFHEVFMHFLDRIFKPEKNSYRNFRESRKKKISKTIFFILSAEALWHPRFYPEKKLSSFQA